MEFCCSSNLSGCRWLLANDALSGDINKASSYDLPLIEGLPKLLCGVIKRNNVVPGGFTAVLWVDSKREACCRTIVSSAEPRVAAKSANELLLRCLWRCSRLCGSCRGRGD